MHTSEPALEAVPSQPGAYYPALDGLRAIAVLAVFSVHYLGARTPLIKNWGALGVDCFFVLSGFLITGILYDSRNKKHRFRDFYARRILRIFPLYYGVWIALLLAWPVFHWDFSAPWLLWPLHLGNWGRFLFLDPNHLFHLDIVYRRSKGLLLPTVFIYHFWTLCVEEQFYLLWPLLVFTVRSRRRLMACCLALVLLEPVLRFVAFSVLPATWIAAEAVWRLTPMRLDSLALGGLLALLMRGPEREWLDRFGRLFAAVAVIFFALCVAIEDHHAHTTLLLNTERFFSTFGLSAIALCSAALILELIRVDGVAAKAFSWTPLRRLGQISYGFYVFHDIPHLVYKKLGGGNLWMTAAIAFCGTLILSTLSFRYYESPILRLKRYFPSQSHTAPTLHATEALHATAHT